MAYCGCATTSAKTRWSAVLFLTALGVFLIIRWIIEIASCRICYSDGSCEKHFKDFQYHWENGREWVEDGEGHVIPGATMSCSMGVVMSFHMLAILSFIAASIPCYINCCCAKHPNQVQAQRNQVPLAQVGPAQLPYAGCHTCADGHIVALHEPMGVAPPTAMQTPTQKLLDTGDSLKSWPPSDEQTSLL